EYHFYSALAHAAHFDVVAEPDQADCLEVLRAHHQQLTIWASNCEANFGDRATLVNAEIARLEGRDLDAIRLYEQAIRLTSQHGFVHNQGLAHEVAGRYYATHGFETSSRAHLRAARYCYVCWGAGGKVQ